ARSRGSQICGRHSISARCRCRRCGRCSTSSVRWTSRRPSHRRCRRSPPKRTRKKGAGHPRWLTDDEITRGRKIVRHALLQRPKLAIKTNDDLTEHFRLLFNFKPQGQRPLALASHHRAVGRPPSDKISGQRNFVGQNKPPAYCGPYFHSVL